MGSNTIKMFPCAILPLNLHCLQVEVARKFDMKTFGLYEVSACLMIVTDGKPSRTGIILRS